MGEDIIAPGDGGTSAAWRKWPHHVQRERKEGTLQEKGKLKTWKPGAGMKHRAEAGTGAQGSR